DHHGPGPVHQHWAGTAETADAAQGVGAGREAVQVTVGAVQNHRRPGPIHYERTGTAEAADLRWGVAAGSVAVQASALLQTKDRATVSRHREALYGIGIDQHPACRSVVV